MIKDIIHALIGRVPECLSCVGYNCQVYKVKNHAFPFLRHFSCEKPPVKGVLYYGLTEKELKILDEYEEDDFRKILIQTSKGEALTYTIREEGVFEEDGDWDLKNFKVHHLQSYLKNLSQDS